MALPGTQVWRASTVPSTTRVESGRVHPNLGSAQSRGPPRPVLRMPVALPGWHTSLLG